MRPQRPRWYNDKDPVAGGGDGLIELTDTDDVMTNWWDRIRRAVKYNIS